ncbi:MAG TPA: valine--tRNA ligase [Candidatus Saccharimonadales bacterium]|nr:valine--tRNA ligase [Candidatus Saccharimonadales bacterium]
MNLPKVYEPALFEADIQALWEKSGVFTPSKRGKSYSIVMPPPNANGNAHLGTAITIYLEDIAMRYHRLKGENCLFLPGADHAGFETQVVFEKQLAKEGKSRFDFSREQLYQQIWDFVASNRQNFESQFRRLGASVDWSRYTFTLDDKIIKRAYATFKKMWEEGLIYRGERLVNFCTFHGTAFADIEVAYKEEKSHLWYINYPLTDGNGELVVATTRPETMLGDMAVAVNPHDKRYKKYIGKTVRLPLTEREIPIIADNFVDQSFGTGVVKITPAHDPNDFEAGKRHDLPMLTVIDFAGNMVNVSDRYRGLGVDDARKLVVADLEKARLLVRIEDYTHNVGHCYKCGTIIQQLLREQWFVDMQPLAQRAIATLQTGAITFYPASKQEQLIGYLQQLHDWNISRQIAWGIPIPAFQNVDQPDDWIYDERVDQEVIEIDGKTYRRDPDVFDTWFSSSSWPYATLDYPDSDDFTRFYPLSLMETGGEILYPWVSRMLMLGLYVTDTIPFKSVYIHGYVMAEDGMKMSKSLGNVINPLDAIDSYGSDALRMGLIASRAPAVNRGYDPRKVADARNFCNKLWNIARYVASTIDGQTIATTQPKPRSAADHWIFSELRRSVDAIAEHLDTYRFAEAYDQLYHFVWDDFADWYIEASKVNLNPAALDFALQSILKIAHPFAPFVTEALWQTLQPHGNTLLVRTEWPTVKAGESQKATGFEHIKTLVSEIRSIKNTLGFTHEVKLAHQGDFDDEQRALLEQLAHVVAEPGQQRGLRLLTGFKGVSCWLDIDEKLLTRYAAILADQQATETQTVERLEIRLKNKQYVSKAPEKLVAETRSQLRDAKNRLAATQLDQQRLITTT